MAKKNAVKAVEVQAVEVQAEQIDKLASFETVLLGAIKAGALKAEQIDNVIVKAGFNVPESEHADARPINKADAAKAELLAFGVDVDALQADTAQAGKLAITFDALGRALGGKLTAYMTASDAMHSNGTHLVTYYITSRLLAGQARFSIAEVNEFANKTYTRPKGTAYMSTGHVATIKRLLGLAGFNVNSSSGFFSITA